jgi:hypothetical protein
LTAQRPSATLAVQRFDSSDARDRRKDIEAIAHAEAYEQDPLRSRRAETAATADAYGIGAMFAAP